MPNRFDGLIFDMGDILYDASEWRRWLVQELLSWGVKVSYRELVDRWEGLLADVYRGKSRYWDRFEVLLEDFGLEEADRKNVERRAKQEAVAVGSRRRLMPGVSETLSRLRDMGLRLAVLSDNESGSDRIREILSELGIEAKFDAVVSSADVGAVKPEEEAYRAASEAIGLSFDKCAFVGHDRDELDGARAVRLYTIAYNSGPEVDADHRIDHFAQLADFVSGHG